MMIYSEKKIKTEQNLIKYTKFYKLKKYIKYLTNILY